MEPNVRRKSNLILEMNIMQVSNHPSPGLATTSKLWCIRALPGFNDILNIYIYTYIENVLSHFSYNMYFVKMIFQ